MRTLRFLPAAALAAALGCGPEPDPPGLAVSTVSLAAWCVVGTDAEPQTLDVYNTGEGTVSYAVSDDAAWLDCAPASGQVSTGTDTVTVAFSTSGLPLGDHTATITVDAGGAGTKYVSVALSVTAAPEIQVSTNQLDFVADEGGPNPASQTLGITNSGDGILDWEVSIIYGAAASGWLLLSPSSGSSTGETDQVTVSADVLAGTWEPTSTTGPALARGVHTAVWTGAEMIVWGGCDEIGILGGGKRYDPATDSWQVVSGTGTPPSPRLAHTAVWTGSEMVIWGGTDLSDRVNTGSRYDPVTDKWQETSTTDAPSARDSHTAVWTGTEMIVWGGFDGTDYVNTGGRYDPSGDSWLPISTTDAPSPARSRLRARTALPYPGS